MATVEVIGVPRYVLTLTKEEARTLLFISNQIGGSPEGRRGDMDSISESLSNAGITVPQSLGDDAGTDFQLNDRSNSIYFVK